MANTAQPTSIKRPSEVATTQQKADGWENTITGLGTSRDKQTGTRVRAPGFQQSRETFDDLYHSDDTAATIARLPATEMTREWITLQVDDSVGDTVRTENTTEDKMLTAKNVMQALEDVGAKGALADALTWAAVHGGGLLFLGVNDGIEDLSEPLDLDRVRSLDFLTVYDRWELHVQETNQDPRTKNFGKPEVYLLQTSTESGMETSEAVQIHASRFIRLDGTKTTRRRMARNNGWSDSVYVKMRQTLEGWGISWLSITHLFQDMSQAVLKMKGLADAICQQESNLVLDRMTAMDLCRSVARAIPIDADDEDFIRVATPLAGVPELIDRLMLRVASAADQPATLLFGQSPSGLNATGESDIRFFYDRMKGRQDTELRPALNRLLEVLFAAKEGPTKGTEPENWSYEFNPLWQMTDLQEAEVRKKTAETDQIYIMEGVTTPDEVAMSRHGGDAYSTETVLDMEKRQAEPEEEPAVLEPTFRVVDHSDGKNRSVLIEQLFGPVESRYRKTMTMDQFDDEIERVCDVSGARYNPARCAEMKRAKR